MSAAKKGGLGRGLEALFADVPVKEPAVAVSYTHLDVYKRQIWKP